jgi:hypothetical protein
MKAREPGRGSIFQRTLHTGAIRWVAQVSHGPRDLRTVTRRVFQTREQAEAWLDERALGFDFEAAFWAKVDKSGDCWVWTSVMHRGYGVYGSRARRRKAHRWAWEFANGPVPAGLEIDHLCRNRACVRPDHLEPVTHAENVRRAIRSGHSPGDSRARKT